MQSRTTSIDDISEKQAKKILDGLAKISGFDYFSASKTEFDDLYSFDSCNSRNDGCMYLCLSSKGLGDKRSMLRAMLFVDTVSSKFKHGKTKEKSFFKDVLKQMLELSKSGHSLLFTNYFLEKPQLRNGTFLRANECFESIIMKLELAGCSVF